MLAQAMKAPRVVGAASRRTANDADEYHSHADPTG
jgi:hypothetical protein